MQFSLYEEAAGSCEQPCALRVLASGLIQPDTVRAFEDFAARHDLRGATLVLQSEGGSVHGALALGRAIRKLGMNTSVGGSAAPQRGIFKGALSRGGLLGRNGKTAPLPAADCESMCVFVLMGGVRREVPEGARVRVHQIWIGDRRGDAAAVSYSAEDIALIQRDIGKLAQYTQEMGGSIDLLELSLRIPPWEPMRMLSREEIARMNLDSGDDASPATPPAIAGDASPATTGGVNRMIVANEDRGGWTFRQQEKLPVLIRNHPLTFEGEELGRIEIILSCNKDADGYAASYREIRWKANDGSVPPSLKSVRMRIGETSISLKPERTKAGAFGEAERVHLARGTWSGDMAQRFSDINRALNVSAETEDGHVSNIRIGNAGVAKHLPELAAACKQTRQTYRTGIVTSAE